MFEPPRRTPHGRWAAGAAVLLASLVYAVLVMPPPAPSRSTEEVELSPPPALPAPAAGAGRVVCGFCNGDGRLDPEDLRRQAPRLDLNAGPCAACAGKGGR